MAVRKGQTKTGRSANGNREGDATRRTIIVAAEKLFARGGIDGVSIRDITTAAKVNTAAIHYHFGSKRALVGAILETRAADLGRRRAGFIEALKESDLPTARQVAEAMVLPTAQLFENKRGGGQHYVAFIAWVAGHPDYASMVGDRYEQDTRSLTDALELALPDLPPEICAFRFALAKVLVNQAFGQPGQGLHIWVNQRMPGSDTDFTERLVDFVVGALDAPSTI